MQVPDDIVESVRNRQCILFLGAMASAKSPMGSPIRYDSAPPSGAELSMRLASRFRYPDEDVRNLQRVALYAQYGKDGSKEALVRAIKEEITAPDIEVSPALRMLAELPFPIIITTNYDGLFDIALSRANTLGGRPKRPLIQTYDPTRTDPTETAPLDPVEEQPVLLKLHGDIDRPETVVVTEEDYIEFVQKMSISTPDFHPIHPNIRARMRTWPVLFIGYSLKDYNLRLLFRTLRWNVDPANYRLMFSVDPSPDNLIVEVWQRAKPMVSFITEDLWDFVPALHREFINGENDDHH